MTRETRVIDIKEKSGRSGLLVFVVVRHEISNAAGLAVAEEHDIVYREAAKPGEPPPPGKAAPQSSAWRREIVPDPVLLFRFSALTFNGHRIHYDLDYSRHEENYPGLIVHGPLQTLLMLDLARNRETRPVKKFDYRALQPVFHTERFTVNGNPSADATQAELWTTNAAGQYAMTGTAYY